MYKILSLVGLGVACLLATGPEVTAMAATRSARDSYPVLSSYRVKPNNEESMREIALKFEVLRRRGTSFEILVPASRSGELFTLAPGAELLEFDIDAQAKQLAQSRASGYHNFTTVEEHLNRIVKDHGDIAKLDTYGKSQEGRPLFVLRLNGKALGSKPQVMITSATHGNEIVTVEVVFGLIDALVENYGKDQRLTSLLDNHEIYFIPVVNPDGYVRQSRYANGVDPNREYPYPDEPQRDPNEAIKAEIAFYDAHNFKATLDYHSFAGVMMYPWSYTNSPVEGKDQQLFESLTRKMAQPIGYEYGQISQVMYIARGGSADYYYWKNHATALAVEVGDSNAPGTGSLPRVVQGHLEPTWLFVESVH